MQARQRLHSFCQPSIDLGQRGRLFGPTKLRVPAGQLFLNRDHGYGQFARRVRFHVLTDDGVAMLIEGQHVGIEDKEAQKPRPLVPA
jgi:hypothetical protein